MNTNLKQINEMEIIPENIIDQVVDEKLNDAMTPTTQIEFTPEEAEIAGAFKEEAISESDAEESQIDGIDGD